MERRVFNLSDFCTDLGVADVLVNWQNVFRAINLATGTDLVSLSIVDNSEIRIIRCTRGGKKPT